MKSRMEKYYSDDTVSTVSSRITKNQDLYQEINHSEIDSFQVNSNASVLADQSSVIDIDDVKEMLDKKYSEMPKRRSIKVETPEEESPISFEETKEYDINSILEKAREQKTNDYEKDRFKKLRDTQYDILKSLQIQKEDPEKEAEAAKKSKEEEKLMDLINTIAIKEEEMKKGLDPLDILSDLKGSGKTEVLAGLREDVQKSLEAETKKPESVEEKAPVEVKTDEENTGKIDRSFYTNSMSFSKKDFDDFSDIADSKSRKVVIALIAVFIVIAILIVVLFVLNHFLHLGFF